jgi:trehalose 6-phosphate synthase
MQVRQEKERLTIDLQRRSSLLGESLKETVEPLLEKGRPERLQKIVEKFGNRERLAGVAVYDVKDKLIAITPSLSGQLHPTPKSVKNVMNSDQDEGLFSSLGGKEMYLYALPLHSEESVVGALVIVQNPSYIEDRLALIWKSNFIRFLVYAFVISLTTLLLIRWSMAGPIAKMAEWMKHLRTEKNKELIRAPSTGIFEPLTKEVTQMARSISAAREAAEEEARLRHTAESVWTPARLKEQVRTLLRERSLFVISNREPYLHEKKGKKD